MDISVREWMQYNVDVQGVDDFEQPVPGYVDEEGSFGKDVTATRRFVLVIGLTVIQSLLLWQPLIILGFSVLIIVNTVAGKSTDMSLKDYLIATCHLALFCPFYSNYRRYKREQRERNVEPLGMRNVASNSQPSPALSTINEEHVVPAVDASTLSNPIDSNAVPSQLTLPTLANDDSESVVEMGSSPTTQSINGVTSGGTVELSEIKRGDKSMGSTFANTLNRDTSIQPLSLQPRDSGSRSVKKKRFSLKRVSLFGHHSNKKRERIESVESETATSIQLGRQGTNDLDSPSVTATRSMRTESSKSTPTSKEISYSRRSSVSDIVPQAYKFIHDFDDNFDDKYFDSFVRTFTQRAKDFNLDDIELKMGPDADMDLVDEPEEELEERMTIGAEIKNPLHPQHRSNDGIGDREESF